MPLRSDWTGERCPIARSLEVLGDPWVMLVLRQAFSGVRRFEQFRDQLGVAENVLSKRLSTMVDAGLLRRVPYQDQRRTRHEYVLTEAGARHLPDHHRARAMGRAASATRGSRDTDGHRPPQLRTPVHHCGLLQSLWPASDRRGHVMAKVLARPARPQVDRCRRLNQGKTTLRGRLASLHSG